MAYEIDPQTFADEWIAAWNERDLDRILSHHAEKVVFRSPRIVLVTGDAILYRAWHWCAPGLLAAGFRSQSRSPVRA